MPAIGASTTGTGTVSGPRDRGMPRLSGGGCARPNCHTAGLDRLDRPEGQSALLRLGDRAGPGDGVEVLGRAEADRHELPVPRREVDQTHRRLLAAGELRRQWAARTRREEGLE